MRFVDFGNTDVPADNDIFELPENVRHIPFRSIHCKIRGIDALVGNTEAVEMTEANRSLFRNILTLDKLVGVFHENKDGDPPYEVELVSLDKLFFSVLTNGQNKLECL